MKTNILVLVLMLIFSTTYSQIRFSESFNYPFAANGDSITGPNTGSPIWIRHSGGGSIAKDIQYQTTSLFYNGYNISSGGAVTFQCKTRSQDINADLGVADSVGSVYASFLLRIDSSGGKDTATDYFFHFSDVSGTSVSIFRGRLFVADGSSVNTFKLGIGKATSAKLTAANIIAGAKPVQFTTAEFNIGQTYFVILKYTFNTSSLRDDEMKLFVLSGNIPSTEPTANITFIDTAFSDLNRIKSVCIRQGSIGTTMGVIDELRVFTNWNMLSDTSFMKGNTCISSQTVYNTICNSALPYIWNGNSYSTSGTYTTHLTNAKGCDSAVTLVLTVKPTSSSTINATICSGRSFTFNGNTYATAGTYTSHFTNASGCDSAVTLNLSVMPAPTTTSTSISGTGFVVYNGVTYINSTTVNDTIKSYLGCDSVYNVVNINVIKTNVVVNNITLQGCDSVVYKGVTYKSSTIVRDTIRVSNQAGSVYWREGFNNTTGKINNSSTDPSVVAGTVSVTYQQGDVGTWALYGAYRTTGAGCSSFGLGHIRMLKYTDGTTPWVVSPIVNNGISEIHFTPTTAGKRWIVLWTADTAATSTNWTKIIDSISIKNSCIDTVLVINQPTAKRIKFKDATNAAGYQLDFDSVYLKSTSSFQVDSVYNVVNITINKKSISTTNVSICPGNSYTFNGNTYSTAGTYTTHLTNVAGCDSSVTLVLTLKQTSISTTNASIISGNSYTFNGNAYTTPGTYTVHLTNKVGCDSAATLILKTIIQQYGTKTMFIDKINIPCSTQSSTITVPIRVKNFSNIVYFQGSINWDNTKLKYAGINYSTIAPITTNASNISLRDTALGRFGILWMDPNASGVNVPDSFIVLSLKFNIVQNGTTANIIFSNLPTYQEIDTIDQSTFIPVATNDTAFIGGYINTNYKATTTNVSVSGTGSVVYNGITYTNSTIKTDTIKSYYGCDSIYKVATITIYNGTNTCDTSLWKARAGCLGPTNDPWIGASSFIKNGILNFPPSLVVCNPSYYWSGHLLKDTMKVNNNFSITYRFMNPASGGGIGAYDASFWVLAKNGAMNSGGNFEGIAGYSQYAYAAVGSTKASNLSQFVIDLSTWRTIKYVYNNNIVSYFIDGSLVYQLPYTGNIDTIQGIDIEFKGSGQVDYIYLSDSNNNVVWREDFDSCSTLKHFPKCAITPITKNSSLSGCNSVIYKSKVYTNTTIVYDTVRSTGGCDSVFNVVNITIQSISPANLQNGLIAYYPFNGNAKDESGNNKHGTISGNATYVLHNSDSAITLKAQCQSASYCTGNTGDHVMLPWLPFNSMNKFSINLWVNEKSMQISDGEAYINYGNVQNTNGAVQIAHYSNMLYFQTSTSTAITYPFDNADTDKWQMYTLTYDNGLLKAFKKGVLLDSIRGTVNVPDTTTCAIARHWWNTTSTRFNGSIDEVRIYNRIIDSSEIASLYNSVSFKKTVTTIQNLYGCNSVVYNGVTYTSSTLHIDTLKSLGGCDSVYKVANINISALPSIPTITPSTVCTGNNITFTAGGGTIFEFLKNGVSQGVPSTTSTYIASTVTATDQICVKSYSLPSIDGNLITAEWGNPLATSVGGPASSGFGNGNNIDALYMKSDATYIYGGIAGSLSSNSGNKILLFIDSKSGGFNSMSGWTSRSNTPDLSIKNLNSGITFDAGFTPDYILQINYNGSVAYYDLYDMQNNNNTNLNSNPNCILSYQANSGTGDFTKGFEFAFPLSFIGNPSGTIKLFAMLANNPVSTTATFISNQFLTHASSSEGNYSNGSIVFSNASPDPVTVNLGLSCYTQTCAVINPKPNAGVDQIVCQNTTATMAATGTGAWTAQVGNPATTIINTVNSPTTTITGLSIAGTYNFIWTNAGGCADTASVIVNGGSANTISKTACSAYFWHGTTYSTTGSYTFDTLNVKGCDSLTTLNLTITKPTTASITKTVCDNYTWHGVTYKTSGVYTFDSLNKVGCDSLTTLNLTITKSTTANIAKTVCDIYKWHGVTYTTSGVYTFDSLNKAGCDSLTTLNLTITKSTTASITKTVCDICRWHGVTYTTSGVYTFDSLNKTGCDSLMTLNLTITKSTTANIAKTVCDIYKWHGVTYTTSGVYTFDSLNKAGCDSLTTLNLTITKSTTASITKTVCDSYLWHGVTYITSGVYTFDSLNKAGCDSLTTLYLTIKQSSSSTSNITVFANQLPYTWNGLTFNVAGSQTAHLTNVVGCDSAATLNLTVKSSLPKTLFIAKMNTCNTGIVELPVYMKNMKNISSFQGTINWDHAVMSFAGLNNNGVGNVSLANKDTALGRAGFLWIDPTMQGGNFTDSSIAFSLKFNVLNTVLGKTSLSFSTLTTKLEIDTIDIVGSMVYKTVDTAFIGGWVNFTGKPSQSYTAKTVCQKLLPYNWNGIILNASGTQTAHLINATGCDSAATMALTVVVPTSNTLNLSGCNNVVYKGITYYTSTIVKDTIKTSAGCDSVYNSANISINSNGISGNIVTPNKKAYIIPNVKTIIAGTIKDSVIGSSNYSFSCLPMLGNYSIKNKKNNDVIKANGVSTIDAAMVQSHVLQKSVLNNPYKIIAADVSGDGNVSALDIVYIKRLILALDTVFPGKRLWAFVDSSYKFPDTTNPFPYKDSISFTGLSASKTNQTFIGMKLGDVNWDWNPAIAKPYNNTLNAIEFSYSSDGSKSSDGYIRIPVMVKNFKEMMGMQFTLGFNTEVMTFKGIENNILNIETGTNYTNEGKLSMLWLDPKNEVKTLDDNTQLMVLVFERASKEAIGIQNTLSIDGTITTIEAFDKDYQLHGIIMKPTCINLPDITKDSWVVAPNPTTEGVIHVQMNLKAHKTIVFHLVEVAGKVIMSKKVIGEKGANNFVLRPERHIPEGVYYLKAEGIDGLKQLRIKN